MLLGQLYFKASPGMLLFDLLSYVYAKAKAIDDLTEIFTPIIARRMQGLTYFINICPNLSTIV